MHHHYDFYGYEKTSNVKRRDHLGNYSKPKNNTDVDFEETGRECTDWTKYFTKERKIHFRIP